MSVPVSHLMVEEAHKEFNSLADKIAAKYEQLDSGEFGAVGTPAFNAKSAKLASIFAGMSANASTTSQAAVLQALKSTFRVKITGMQTWCPPVNRMTDTCKTLICPKNGHITTVNISRVLN